MMMPDTFLVVCLDNGHDYCYHSRLGTSRGCQDHSLLSDTDSDCDYESENECESDSESDNLKEGNGLGSFLYAEILIQVAYC
jgi:hypothetical protein